jgi:hypothetical protein
MQPNQKMDSVTPAVRTEFELYFKCFAQKELEGRKHFYWQGKLEGVDLTLVMSFPHIIENRNLVARLNTNNYVRVEVSGNLITHALLRQLARIVSLLAFKKIFGVRIANSPEDHGIFSNRGKILVEKNGATVKRI